MAVDVSRESPYFAVRFQWLHQARAWRLTARCVCCGERASEGRIICSPACAVDLARMGDHVGGKAIQWLVDGCPKAVRA